MKCVPQAGIDQAAFIIGYQLLCGYVVLLIVLAIRPQGILGKG